MSEKPVPPYRRRPSLAEKLVLNSTFGRLGSRFNSGGIVESTLPVCHDYQPQPNQEKPMTQCQTPKPAYLPGDRVLCLNSAICEPGTIEVVFISFDPEQPNVALVRDVGNVNAPIRGVHNSYIKALPPKPVHRVVEMFARRGGVDSINGVVIQPVVIQPVVVEPVDMFDPCIDQPLRIIAARVTEDGLLQVKVDMTKSVERDAILAANEKPTTDF